MAYLGLFFTAFIAATLLPAASEGLVAVLVSQEKIIWLVWLCATLGNTLGSCVNWWLGKEITRFGDKPWFPIKPAALKKAQQQFSRYGLISLLFAWLPIVGDPLTFIAGIMRVKFSLFIVLVGIGKGVRYGVVIAIALGVLN